MSTPQPINNAGYVVAAVLESVFYNEAITVGKVIGITAIMLEVFFLARSDVAEK